MSMTEKGISTCKSGEKYEPFYSPVKKKTLYHYDYRHTDGELFSTIAETLEVCRFRLDVWLKNKGAVCEDCGDTLTDGKKFICSKCVDARR